MSDSLVEATNENLRVIGETMAGHVPGGATRRFGPVLAASTDLPAPNFNRVLVTTVPDGDEIAAAVRWLADRDVPFWVTATDETAAAVANHDGPVELAVIDDAPGMALSSLEDLPAAPPVATIDEVTDEAVVDDFVAVFAEAFDAPRDLVERTATPSLLADDAIRPFVGRVDGDPVACGQLVRSGDVAGVYNVGVVPDYRRRGLGEAVTGAVLRAGRADGCRIGVLQSSEMAVPLYEGMGFETVVTYRHFAPVDQA